MFSDVVFNHTLDTWAALAPLSHNTRESVGDPDVWQKTPSSLNLIEINSIKIVKIIFDQVFVPPPTMSGISYGKEMCDVGRWWLFCW